MKDAFMDESSITCVRFGFFSFSLLFLSPSHDWHSSLQVCVLSSASGPLVSARKERERKRERLISAEKQPVSLGASSFSEPGQAIQGNQCASLAFLCNSRDFVWMWVSLVCVCVCVCVNCHPWVGEMRKDRFQDTGSARRQTDIHFLDLSLYSSASLFLLWLLFYFFSFHLPCLLTGRKADMRIG